jgi:hypothetical protein
MKDCNKVEKKAPKKTKLTKKWQVRVGEVVAIEGFDYAFRSYTAFEDVKDERFHELRKAYIAAADALADYSNVDEFE